MHFHWPFLKLYVIWNEDFITSDYDVMVLFTFSNSWASKRDWGEYSNVMDVTDPRLSGSEWSVHGRVIW